jgi:hypothetical protein
MTNRINLPPRAPPWPWGGPRSVRERLVDPEQFDRKKKARKAGNPKSPSLPSAALLDSIGPAHTADELRLPLPPHPEGHDADLAGFSDRPALDAVAERADQDAAAPLFRSLSLLAAPPERVERLRQLLGREEQMLSLVGALRADLIEIQRKVREEQKESGY